MNAFDVLIETFWVTIVQYTILIYIHVVAAATINFILAQVWLLALKAAFDYYLG